MLNRTLVILRLNDVKSRTGLSRSTIYARMAEGGIPIDHISGWQISWLGRIRNQRLDQRKSPEL